MFKHILLPTDGSPSSEDAARRAVEFAKAVGAKITAFYVKREYPDSYATEGFVFDSPTGRFEQLAEEEGQEILDFVEALCRTAGVICTKLIHAQDSVYEAIVEAATQNECDLIFMASHGRSGIGALLLGSETNKVLTHTKIPVLVYR